MRHKTTTETKSKHWMFFPPFKYQQRWAPWHMRSMDQIFLRLINSQQHIHNQPPHHVTLCSNSLCRIWNLQHQKYWKGMKRFKSWCCQFKGACHCKKYRKTQKPIIWKSSYCTSLMMYKTEDTKTWTMPRQSESTQISGSLVSCLRSQYLRRPIDWRALLTQLSPQIKVVMIYVPLATIWEHSAAQCTLLKTPPLAWKRSKIHTGVSKGEHPESQGNWTLDSCLKVNVLARQRTCRRVIAERQTNETSALTPPANLQPQFAECARLCVTAGGRRRSRSDAGGSTPRRKACK